MKRTLRAIALAAALTSAFECSVLAQISDDPRSKTLTICTRRGSLSLRVNYGDPWKIDRFEVRGHEVLDPSAGITTGLKIDGTWQNWGTSPKTRVIATRDITSSGSDPFFREIGTVITPVDDEGRAFSERWAFRLRGETIEWTVDRFVKKPIHADEVSFAHCSFKDASTWSGAILGTGGVAWSPRFESPQATLGVHTGKAILWSRERDDALEFEAVPNANYVSALRFTSQRSGALEMSLAITPDRLATRHGVARFLPDRADVWQPIEIEPYATSVTLRLHARRYASKFDRGELNGVDESSVRELMNTIARYGVVDDTFMGSNGWNGVALHEPWIAQLGIAIDDANYVASFAKTMNEERDHAMAKDGRVKSRWTSNANDAEPGTYDELGYYEAQWGRLLDSQTSYVINAADQFDLSGDIDWMRGQKEPCERALEFLLRRDADGDGLVEVDSDSCKNHKSSDWIDVVWASHESAYINAQLYEALRRLAEIERVLGDDDAAKTYDARALRLKEAFDRPTTEGGFWSADHSWYVYWREKDDSIHGDNLTVPVNLMAIAYGLCDDEVRIRAILDRIEQCVQSENLFFWPICVLPFAPGEANDFQYPFPNYENGDLFLAFGELGTRAYVKTDPRIAFRIVKNVLARFEKDGLAFQRYLRARSKGRETTFFPTTAPRSSGCTAISTGSFPNGTDSTSSRTSCRRSWGRS